MFKRALMIIIFDNIKQGTYICSFESLGHIEHDEEILKYTDLLGPRI